MRYILVCLLAWLVNALSALAIEKPKTVVVFGDSITAGSAMAGNEREQLWLRVIERESQGKLCLINEGKGGRPTASRAEFDAMLGRQPRMDQLVIALGMNDSRDLSDSCVPKAVANLRYMIEQARHKHGAALPVLLVGPSNLSKEALVATKPIAKEREAKLKELGAAFEQLAKETHCDYVSLFGVVPESSLTKDGVHPDAGGNQPIARTIKAWLLR